jgi:hypothetical protein
VKKQIRSALYIPISKEMRTAVKARALAEETTLKEYCLRAIMEKLAQEPCKTYRNVQESE